MVQASRASDSDRPPAYWIADNSKLLGQGRESRSSKPEEFYSLVPAERVRKSLDDTTDYTSEKFHHLTPILPAAASAPEATDDSFNSDEFSTKLNVLSLHDASPNVDVLLNDEVFDVASTTAEVHDLGARSKVSTSWPEVVYTSVGRGRRY